MKREVKKIDGIKAEIDIEVSGDIVKNKFEEVFNKIGQTAKIAGFRPGKAPRDILEKNFSSQAHEEVLKELIPQVYNEAVEKEGLEVLNLPEISQVRLERSKLAFKATVETPPEIKLKDYKGLKVNYAKIEVAADDVKRSLDALKESRKLDALDDSLARALGYPNLAEMQAFIEKQLFIQKENSQRQKIESEIIAQLSYAEFQLPQSLVRRQLEDLLKEARLNLALRGLSREKIEEEEKSLLTALEPQARKQVQVYLVLAEIAKRENITKDEQMPRRVMEFLLKEADWQLAA